MSVSDKHYKHANSSVGDSEPYCDVSPCPACAWQKGWDAALASMRELMACGHPKSALEDYDDFMYIGIDESPTSVMVKQRCSVCTKDAELAAAKKHVTQLEKVLNSRIPHRGACSWFDSGEVCSCGAVEALVNERRESKA